MAYTRKRQRKDGSFFYEIAVSRGRGQTPYTMRWNMPEGLTTKTINKQLAIVAALFEKDCHDGKVKTRKEEKAAVEQAEQERLSEEHEKMTFQKFCEGRFMPDIKARCSNTTAYNYELQFKNHVYPAIGSIELPRQMWDFC